MGGYYLSIDAGTSSVKAILFDGNGRIVSAANQKCELMNPAPDRYEMDLDAFYEKLCLTIRACLSASDVRPDQIRSVGASAYMTGTIFLDREGRQVGSNIVWIDSRTTPLLRQWEESGLARESYRLTGTSLLPGHTLPLFYWWKRNHPEVLEKADCHLFMKDWIRYKLTGVRCTDPSEATCLPSDTRTRNWSREVMRLYDLEDCMRILPPIRPSAEIVGRIHARAAADTGLTEGTPFICGLGDMLAGILGAGALSAGQGVTILGSTLLNSVIMEAPNTQPEGIGMTLATVGNQWVRFVNNTGGGTINSQWAIDTLMGDDEKRFSKKSDYFSWLNGLVAKVPPCANGVMYHPYINSTGVTAPFYCVGARAQFTGIGLHHTRLDLLRAVYEGIAMAIRDCYGAIEGGTREIRVSGGGSRSDVLCQIIADVCGVEILQPAEAEATALGTAILAAYATREYASIEEAARCMTNVSKRFEPDRNAGRIYDEWFGLFRAISRSMIPLWEERTKVLERIRQ